MTNEETMLASFRVIPNLRHLPKKKAKDGDLYYVEDKEAVYVYVDHKWSKCFKIELEVNHLDDSTDKTQIEEE